MLILIILIYFNANSDSVIDNFYQIYKYISKETPYQLLMSQLLNQSMTIVHVHRGTYVYYSHNQINLISVSLSATTRPTNAVVAVVTVVAAVALVVN